MNEEAYSFTRHNRSQRTVTTLIAVYAFLIGLVIVFQAAWWLMLFFALPTLPTLWDLWANTSAGLTIENGTLSWFSGKRTASMQLAEIDYARFDTRWDFSVRVTLYPHTGKTVRLPYETLPPHKLFEDVLTERGIRVERHHFTVL